MSDSEQSMSSLEETSLLGSDRSAYLEMLYEQYVEDPNSVSAHWRSYFDALPKSHQARELPHSVIQAQFADLARQPCAGDRLARDKVAFRRPEQNVVKCQAGFDFHRCHFALRGGRVVAAHVTTLAGGG